MVQLDDFLQYCERVRERTMRVIQCVPADKLEWTYQNGRFTIGDLMRHIASIERYMYGENAQFQPSRYPGHTSQLAGGLDGVLQYMDRCHQESMEIFRKLTAEDLHRKCITPNGTPITLWKWLRAMVEHEVHHRGQIYFYLAMLEIPTPPLYGLTSEQVRSVSLG